MIVYVGMSKPKHYLNKVRMGNTRNKILKKPIPYNPT